jgi:hypothetical protein
MDPAPPAAPSAAPTDPPQDHPATTLPNNIAVILHPARILLDYGRHLIDTVRHRAGAPSFNAIAACFGTANLSTILAHLNRGLLRAVALRRVLLARAAAGQDVDFFEPRIRAPETQRASVDPESEQLTAEPPIRKPRASRPVGWDDPEHFMPSLEDLERQARSRPVGRTILDICLDLALVPGFCTSDFWNELFEIMHLFGGSVVELMQQRNQRITAFSREKDRSSDNNRDWLHLQRDALRQVLGFFVGEPPINPFDPAAALATAPP